jgi:Fe2+ transport system protein FeoA
MIEIESQLPRLDGPRFSIAMPDLVPLHHLPNGDSARVMHILGCPEQVQRVKEMGICDGAEIEMVRSGTPCIIRAGSQTLCVRGNDLLTVLVERGAKG